MERRMRSEIPNTSHKSLARRVNIILCFYCPELVGCSRDFDVSKADGGLTRKTSGGGDCEFSSANLPGRTEFGLGPCIAKPANLSDNAGENGELYWFFPVLHT